MEVGRKVVEEGKERRKQKREGEKRKWKVVEGGE